MNHARPKKLIAIGLVESMGDIVACEPVARALRALHPQEHLLWCVREEFRELIDANPAVDETYVVTCVTEWELLVQSRVFDDYVDLHLNHHACETCRIPNQKYRGNLQINRQTLHAYGSVLSAMAQGAGLPALNNDPKLSASRAASESVDRLALPSEYCVIHRPAPDAAHASWPEERWSGLSALIQQRLSLPVIEVGETCPSSSGPSGWIDLRGRLSILERAEVINRAVLFIGEESDEAILAHAVSTFGVVLMKSDASAAGGQAMPFSGEYGNGINAALLYAEHGGIASLTIERVFDAVQANRAFAQRQKEHKHELSNIWSASVAAHNGTGDARARLIAFYLPQFHPIPENDAWGGKGFTEWTNVAKARPLFPSHYQPHIPGELGFYDLRVRETRAEQAALARAHGIEGFCYWHYWFGNGKRLLERVFDEVLESGAPDFPFCLAWANESWTARWYGTEKAMIQHQEYPGVKDDEAHFQLLVKAFRDHRYIKIDGKPVFLIYYPGKMPDAASTVALWRELARMHGLPGLYLIALKTMYLEDGIDWRARGFDAVLHHMPDFRDVSQQSRARQAMMHARRTRYPNEMIPLQTVRNHFDYATAAASMKRRLDTLMTDHDSYATVVCAWDNSPRYGERATILDDASPEAYERWLKAEVARLADRSSDHRMIFINAWNEWAEGMHLEPDQKFGRGYLEATRRALTGETPCDPLAHKTARANASAFMALPLETLFAQFDRREQMTESEERAALTRSILLKAIRDFARLFHAAKANNGPTDPEAYHRAQSNAARAFACSADDLIGQAMFEQADEMLQLAMNIDKNSVVISKTSAIALAAKGYPHTSLQVLSNLITASPNDLELFHALARLFESIGEHQKAESMYAHILARNPADANARRRSAVLHETVTGTRS